MLRFSPAGSGRPVQTDGIIPVGGLDGAGRRGIDFCLPSHASAGLDPSLSRSGPEPSPPLFRGSGDAAGMRMRGKIEMKESYSPG
jgi:hypothetical protein